MSGLALHRQLVAEGDTTPVIYMTAHDEPSVRVEALNMGCAALFLKPNASAAIIETLRRVTALT
jgi:FixJ family two-component response regulator